MLENQRLFSLVYEPITIKGITKANPELLDIYAEERNPRPVIEAVAIKVGGAALGAIYRVGDDLTRWLGKNCDATGRLQGHDNALHLLKEKDLSTNLEKLAYDIYKEWGRGLFTVPSSFLSKQPVINPYTRDNHLAQGLVEYGIRKCLHVFCRYVDGYQDFRRAETLNPENQRISFVDFINNYHRLPESIFNPAGELVPLWGMLELLAVMRAVGDIDGLGTGGNAGFVWKYNEDRRVIAAQTVKIDPGEAFQFRDQDEKNAVIRTRHGLGTAINRLSDCRDIQTSSIDPGMTIRWRNLTQVQKNIFLSTLMNCLRYKNNPKVLEFLVLREGRFGRQIPVEVGREVIDDLTRWLKIQEEIYKVDLERFHGIYPEKLLSIQYIDRYGELPLPASDKSYPIRELHVNLTLVEQKQEERHPAAGGKPHANLPNNQRDRNLSERDSLYDLFSSPQKETLLELSNLFQPTEDETREIRKVLVVGAAGIGKSTLCQKIAHDWATEQAWSQYKVVYWLPLRKCNGETFHTQNHQKWLVQCLAKLVVEHEFLETDLEKQLRENAKEILILLDGYDEASPEVADRVKGLIELPNLNILLTSRPGAFTAHGRIDRIVETRGFSEAQSLQYAQRFFERDEPDPLEAQRQFNDFLQALRANTICSKIARIPLQLQMLCVLWERYRAADGLPADLTTLYQHMVLELFSWHCQPTRGGEDLRAAKEPAFALLGEIGLSGLQSGQLLIAGTAIERTRQQNLLLATGLLKKNESGQYYFLHLTFQEYLAAQFISGRPQEEQKQFVLFRRNLPQFQLVLSFLVGLLVKQPDGENKAKNFFQWLHQSPGADLLGGYQFGLTLRCLNECPRSLHQRINNIYGLERAFLGAVAGSHAYSTFRKDLLFHVATFSKSAPLFCQSLCSLLQDDRCSGKELIAETLGKMAKECSNEQVAEIIAALTMALVSGDQNQWVCEPLAKALGEIATTQVSDVLTALAQALTNEGMGVHRKIMNAFLEVAKTVDTEQIPAVLAALEPMLEDRNGNVHSYEETALGELIKKIAAAQIPRFFALLVQALKAEAALGELIRETAAAQMPGLFTVLVRTLREGGHWARFKIINIFLKVAKTATIEQVPEILAALIPALNDENSDVCSCALLTLGELTEIATNQQASEILVALMHRIESPVESVPLVKALQGYAKAASSDQVPRLFIFLTQALRHPGAWSSPDLANAFSTVFKVAAPQQASDALAELVLVLENNENREARYCAARVLGEVAMAGAPAEQIPRIVTTLQLLLADENRDARSCAAIALGEIAKIADPQQIPGILAALILALNNECGEDSIWVYVDVIACALEEIAKVANEEQIAEILTALLPALSDGDGGVFEGVAEVLREVAKRATAQQILNIFPAAIKAMRLKYQYNESDESIAEIFNDVINIANAEQVPKIFEALLSLVKGNCEIWENAPEALEAIATIATSEQISTILLRLIPVLQSGEEESSLCVAEIFGKIAKIAAAAEHIPQILAALVSQLSSNANAVWALGDVGKVATAEQRIEILTILVLALKGENSSVCYSAARALGEMAGVATPEQLMEISVDLMRALADDVAHNDWLINVRSSITKALREVTQAASARELAEVFGPLVKALGRNTEIRVCVMEALQAAPLHSYLGHFFRPDCMQLLPVMSELANNQSLPLYVELLDGIHYLCLVENHEKYLMPVTSEQIQQLQSGCVNLPLYTYVSTYLRNG